MEFISVDMERNNYSDQTKKLNRINCMYVYKEHVYIDGNILLMVSRYRPNQHYAPYRHRHHHLTDSIAEL